jgi:hypothetical protein
MSFDALFGESAWGGKRGLAAKCASAKKVLFFN